MPGRAVTVDDLKCWFGCCKRVILEIKTELLQASKQGLGFQYGRVLIWQYFWLVELLTVESQWDLYTLIHTEDGIKIDLLRPFSEMYGSDQILLKY